MCVCVCVCVEFLLLPVWECQECECVFYSPFIFPASEVYGWCLPLRRGTGSEVAGVGETAPNIDAGGESGGGGVAKTGSDWVCVCVNHCFMRTLGKVELEEETAVIASFLDLKCWNKNKEIHWNPNNVCFISHHVRMIPVRPHCWLEWNPVLLHKYYTLGHFFHFQPRKINVPNSIQSIY